MTVLWREHNGLKEHLRTETADVMWKKHLHRHLTFLKNQTKKKHVCIHLVHFYCSSKGTQH